MTSKGRTPQAVTLVINNPQDGEVVPPGTVDSDGTASGNELLKIWARVFATDDVDTSAVDITNPFNEGLDTPEGNVTAGGTIWSFSSLALPSGETDVTLVVWPLGRGDSAFGAAQRKFHISSGSGSGSGSVPAMLGGGGPVYKAAPRFFKLSVEADAFGIAPEPLDPGTLLRDKKVILQFDELNEAPFEPVWRGIHLPDFAESWTLRVKDLGDRLMATLTLQERANVTSNVPFVWATDRWDFVGRNLMTNCGRNPQGQSLPNLCVEPA